VCSVAGDPKKLGTCERGAATGSTAFTGQPGDTCTSGTSCAAGLFCSALADGSGSCAAFKDDAPHILSMTLDGTQPVDGWYKAKPGTKVDLTVKTANVDAVTAKLQSLPGTQELSQDLGTLSKAPGGVYTASFTVKDGLQASLEVVVTASNGDQSALAVKVASIK